MQYVNSTRAGEQEKQELKETLGYCGQDHGTEDQTFNLEMVTGKKSKGAQREAVRDNRKNIFDRAGGLLQGTD